MEGKGQEQGMGWMARSMGTLIEGKGHGACYGVEGKRHGEGALGAGG